MRCESRGPYYLRLGVSGTTKVVYRLEDVEEWAELYSKNATGDAPLGTSETTPLTSADR